ncbi:MAG: LysM peptidoglycan-binding domain-containing protein [Acidimicrobiia bacterium]|nr:LysM peptidoglycan-binding domain-containing protein [Acidimicrobiia bacterium]
MAASTQVLPSRWLILFIALISAFLLLSSRVQADQPAVFDEHQVTAGETLWSISAAATAPGEDVRSTIQTVRETNGLQSAVLVPGQRLLIPSG